MAQAIIAASNNGVLMGNVELTFDILQRAIDSCMDAHVLEQVCSHWFRCIRGLRAIIKRRCTKCVAQILGNGATLADRACKICNPNYTRADLGYNIDGTRRDPKAVMPVQPRCHVHRASDLTFSFLQRAVQRGYLPLVQWGLRHGKRCDRRKLHALAMDNRKLDILRFFSTIKLTANLHFEVQQAARSGFTAFLDEFCPREKHDPSVLDDAFVRQIVKCAGESVEDTAHWLHAQFLAGRLSPVSWKCCCAGFERSQKRGILFLLDQIHYGKLA
jgi:hypothetical protein